MIIQIEKDKRKKEHRRAVIGYVWCIQEYVNND